MPRDTPNTEPPHRTPIRFAMLELIARAGEVGGLTGDDGEFLAALRQIVASGRSPAEDLWEKYRGQGFDPRACIYARYGY